MRTRHLLDDPVRASLLGVHAPLAERCGSALRYRPDVAPFAAVPDGRDPTWLDLAALLGPDGIAVVTGAAVAPPDGWAVESRVPGVQMVDGGDVGVAPGDDVVRLGAADVPAMLALVERTRPGSFGPRTLELGRYLGIHRGGGLVAMAGEGLHPPGWTEISAVCTDAAYRGRGFGARLTRAVAHGIRERGEVPFLHASAANTVAIRLYASLGFRLRTETAFVRVRVAA